MSGQKSFDYIIIGAGIAGLYSALRIRHMVPRASLLVLERQLTLGGRVKMDRFGGTEAVDVVCGAGIGRGSDHLLLDLMDQLEIKYNQFTAQFKYAIGPCEMTGILDFLREEYKLSPDKYSGINFSEFAKLLLGQQLYQHFRNCSGYTDYEARDIHDALYDYGFEHNFGTWTGISVPWQLLIDQLSHKIGRSHIRTNCDIRQISHQSDGYQLTDLTGRHYYCRKLICATTIDTLRRLLPSVTLYRQIHGQPFLRLYGQLDKKSRQILARRVTALTVVKPPVQKIIPINPDKGIYMISYCDNQSAVTLKSYTENTTENRQHLARLLEKSLDLPSGTIELIHIRGYYWPIGTHYYDPLEESYSTRESFIKSAQHPEKNLLVVGEVVSQHQGWVQGALESVATGLTSDFISEK